MARSKLGRLRRQISLERPPPPPPPQMEYGGPFTVTPSTVATLVVDGLCETSIGREPVSVTFKRVPPLPTDLIKPILHKCTCDEVPCVCNHVRPDGLPPPRPESDIGVEHTPHQTLEISVNKFLGYGSSGIVYSVQNHSPPTPDYSTGGGSAVHYAPPFAIKFALRNSNKNMLREAWFYEELGSLQGSVIPRCYGFFQGTIPWGCTSIAWHTAARKTHGKCKAYEDDDEMFEEMGTFNPAHRQLVSGLELNPDGEVITLLLLDLLGEPYLPVGKPLAGISDTIWASYREISEIGVIHGDIRWQNILHARPYLDETNPNLVAPHSLMPPHANDSSSPFQFRIIDFALAQKTNFPTRLLILGADWLDRMLQLLPENMVLGQNEE